MGKQEPMLMESPLTKRVYVVTSYIDHGNGTFTARRKHDVTEQFNTLAKQRKHMLTCEIVPITPGCDLGRCSACGTVADVLSNYCWKCGSEVKR